MKPIASSFFFFSSSPRIILFIALLISIFISNLSPTGSTALRPPLRDAHAPQMTPHGRPHRPNHAASPGYSRTIYSNTYMDMYRGMNTDMKTNTDVQTNPKKNTDTGTQTTSDTGTGMGMGTTSTMSETRGRRNQGRPRRLTNAHEKKVRLASLMKERYRQFRHNLAAEEEDRKRANNHPYGGKKTRVGVPTQKRIIPAVPYPNPPSVVPTPQHPKEPTYDYNDDNYSPASFESMKSPSTHFNPNPNPNDAPPTPAKQLRSAEEAAPSTRSSGIRPEAQPLPRFNASSSPLRAAEAAATHKVLEDRLGPSAPPTFDPSIVVDFFSLLQHTRQSHGLPKSAAPLPRRCSRTDPAASCGRQSSVLINSKSSSDESKVTRRRLKETSAPQIQRINNDNNNNHDDDAENEPQKSRLVSKRARYLQMPSNVGYDAKHKHEHKHEIAEDDLSIYVSTAAPPPPAGHHHVTQFNAMEQDVIHTHSKFGSYSEGNDPHAGIHPSHVTVPTIDFSKLHLLQGVKDSLRKYLKPLISALKPLRKSVPGLPGLDYPILSIVPYTNFYCTNMPWPGFYADTEARCQTWHACDIDGRQSTFLCPNGTVFNQALMVCDWWYNTNCLDAPLLYSLNERLFGPLKRSSPVVPHNRITPELLDTIFV